MEDDRDVIAFKVLVVGESGVGKTSLVQRYTKGIFSEAYKATIGVDFASKRIKWNDKFDVRVQLWDLAGQERFGTQIGVYFREAKGAICVYDVTNERSLAQVAKWKQLVDDKTHNSAGDYIPPSIMLANKIDLIKEVNMTEINGRATQLQFVGGVCISAKNNIGIDDAMKCLISAMLKRRKTDELTNMKKIAEENMKDVIKLDDNYNGYNLTTGWGCCGK